MNRSENLNELFAALAKVQGKIKNPKKSKSGYMNRYKYADIVDTIDVSQKLLEENGLSILQFPGEIKILEITEKTSKQDGSVHYQDIKVPVQRVHTEIGHSSGQFIEFPMDIIAEKGHGLSWGQSIGAVITFARRYARSGVLGIAGDDDTDAQEDVPDNAKSSPKSYGKNVAASLSQELQKPQPAAPKIESYQVNKIKAEFMNHPDWLENTLKWANVTRVEDIPATSYDRIMDNLRIKKSELTMDNIAKKVE